VWARRLTGSLREVREGAAVIVDVVRTPGGKRNGKLSGWHPVDLAAETLSALVARNDLDPAMVDDVILGCVMQVGAQSINIARNAALAAGFPESVPGVTIDRQCGSSQQAAHFAAQGVMAGAYDVVIAGGVEVMSLVPMGASMMLPGMGAPFGPRVATRYEAAGGLVPQGISAEMIAEQWDLSREDLDAYAARSQQRAARATTEGRFDAEILPVRSIVNDRAPSIANGRPLPSGASGAGGVVESGELVRTDEGIRADTTAEGLARLKPAFKPDGGRVTAGNSSQITDGASAALIMSEERAAQLGLRPRARFHAFALAGVDPITMLTGPIPVTGKILERAKMSLDEIDLFEVNEAFASVVLAWLHDLDADPDRVNVNGGAIALGHPLGASGTRLLATLVNELERIGGRYGLQAMCEGGGMANATIIERLG
jgi:acetyl-CoA acyltransferase